MRTTLHHSILLIYGIFLIPQISGQKGLRDIDTIEFIVPNLHKNSTKFLARVANVDDLIDWGGNLYQFVDRGSREIEYGDIQGKFFQYKADPVLRNIGDGTMTLITGIGFNSANDGRFEISGKVKCNDTLPDWNVLMYCQGYMETERERVRQDDGSSSVESHDSFVHNWEKNASGILTEGIDTIGSFRIIMNPREDSLLKIFSANIFPNSQNRRNNNFTVKSDFSAKTSAEIDFGISGIFRGRNFIIISNGIDRKTWIFIDNEFTSMFQEYKATSRKNQIMPYLSVVKNIPFADRRDLVRIAIMSRCMNHILNRP